MARRDGSHDPDDIDALLAEVDQTLHSQPGAGRPTQRSGHTPGHQRGDLVGRLRQASRRALIVGAAAAVIVAVWFAFLPFLAVWSGSIGAFLGAFGATLGYSLLRD
jgi:hypothetical protein